jgi:hypothetical protein
MKSVFIGAFRRHTGTARPFFVHRSTELVVLFIGAALWGLLFAGASAWRGVRRAVACRGVSRYRSGIRDASGSIAFEDGSPSVVVAGPPGPVLVRVAGMSAWGYRLAPRLIATEVVEGDRDLEVRWLITQYLDRKHGEGKHR